MELEALNASGVTGQLPGNKYIPKFQQWKFQATILFTCTKSIQTSFTFISMKHLFRGKKKQIK
jgi:hypothetical protein